MGPLAGRRVRTARGPTLAVGAVGAVGAVNRVVNAIVDAVLVAVVVSAAVVTLSPVDAQAATAATPVTPYSWPTVQSEVSTPPVTVTDGLTYGQESYTTADGDAHADVLHADLGDSNVTMVPQLTTGALASDGATLSSTIARTGAVAGVNGDYFDRVGYIAEPAGDGQPTHMLIQGGQIVASGITDDCGVVGYTKQDTVVIGRESFSGTVTDGTVSEPLSAVNEVVWPDSTSQCADKVGSPGLVLETTAWGAQSELDETAPVALLQDLGDGTYEVRSITAGARDSPALSTGESALIGYGASAAFVGTTMTVGQEISVTDAVTPNTGELTEAFGGGYLAVIDGQVNPEIAGHNTDSQAATVIGVTKDGTNLIAGVFDGGVPGEEGVGYSQMGGWLLSQGAYDGIIMDTGGSSEMDARLPGDTAASVLNTPSDGHERLLAECICFYSTEQASGAATSVELHGGAALRVLGGTTVDVGEQALDAVGNPASGTPTVTISPPSAASVVGTVTTPAGETEAALEVGDAPVDATATITDGSATSTTDLDVVTSLASIAISPDEPDVENGATQQLSVDATDSDGDAVTLPAGAATWSVGDGALGTVSDGTFTAAASGVGLDAVTAAAGGASTTVDVRVGLTATTLDPMTDVGDWGAFAGGTGAVASESLSTAETAPAGGAGSLDLAYDLPAGATVEQAGIESTHGIVVTAKGGQDPTAIAVWIKAEGATGTVGSPLQYGTLTVALLGVDHDDDAITLYPTGVTDDGWEQVVGDLPATTVFPFTLQTIDFLVVRPSQDLRGSIFVADLRALYPLPPPPPTFTTFARIDGPTADATAAQELAHQFTAAAGRCPGTTSTRSVVLATDATYPDALASAYLARALGTGTLLTTGTSLAPAAQVALRDEGITQVDVVGGPLALSTRVVDQIESSAVYACGGSTPVGGTIQVSRIAGQTADATAAAVAETAAGVGVGAVDLSGAYAGVNASGGEGEDNDTAGAASGAPSGSGALRTAVLASADEFQDAEAASTLAYAASLPILLTTPTVLSAQASGAITTLGITQVVVMGGPLAVSDAVVASLEDLGVSVLRVAGRTYGDTAAQLARLETAASPAGFGWKGTGSVAVARGNGFTDGLAGSVVAADGPSAGAPVPLLLTTSPTTVGAALGAFLATAGRTGLGGAKVSRFTVLGGPDAITQTTIDAMGDDL